MLWWLLLLMVLAWLVYCFRRDTVRLGAILARHRLGMNSLIFVVVYAGVLGLLLWLENRLVYHPIHVSEYWKPPAQLRPQNVVLKHSNTELIHAWWCAKENAEFTILFSHGNAGNISNHSWIIPEIQARMACNVLIYDYPGFGNSTGVPSEASCYQSGRLAYRWLTEKQNVPAKSIIFMGQSLGCAIACELATRYDHRALILLSPFTSIRELGQDLFPVFPVKWIMSHRYDNQSKLLGYSKPLLIGHSTGDEVIPFAHGERLFDVAGSKFKNFHKIDGTGHNALDAGFFVAMHQFIDQYQLGR